MKNWIRNTVLTVLAGLLLTFCVVQRSPITGQKRAYGYSWADEVKLGAQSDKQIQQQYGIYDDEGLQSYVDEVAQDVLATSHMRGEGTAEQYRNTEFYFRVLDSPVVNAFALPGGYVYVTRGLLGHLRNEAQLAVVLGHEIGHVAARHASQRAFEQQVGQLALVGGAIGGELMGLPGGDILQMGSQAAQLMFLKYGRDDERESDELGVEYAAKQHYRAAEGADFFTTLRRMSEQAGQSIPTWQSTHPDPSARANTIPQLAEQWRQKGFEQNVTDRDQFMRALDDVVFGTNPRQGFTENGMFYHPELAFQFPYPKGWQVVNQASAVQMVNEDQNAIVIFQIDGKNDSPQASVNEFLNQDGITSTGGNGTTSNGLSAYEATANAETQDGSKVKFYLYSAKYNGNVYRFACYTLADQFDSYRSDFVETTNKFQQLRDRNILNIQPAKLRVYKTDRSGTFQSFLPNNMPLDITAEEVAIANQVELNEQIPAGTWIKIPGQ